MIREVLLLMVVVLVSSGGAAPLDDLTAAATGHEGHHGRVQIKVYRGPTKGHGYHKFAPWGYWVKQPNDDHGKHHHGGGGGGYDDHHDDGYDH